MLLLAMLPLRLSGVALDLTGVLAAVLDGVVTDDDATELFISVATGTVKVLRGFSRTGKNDNCLMGAQI